MNLLKAVEPGTKGRFRGGEQHPPAAWYKQKKHPHTHTSVFASAVAGSMEQDDSTQHKLKQLQPLFSVDLQIMIRNLEK